jgi:hypothetical protein
MSLNAKDLILNKLFELGRWVLNKKLTEKKLPRKHISSFSEETIFLYNERRRILKQMEL